MRLLKESVLQIWKSRKAAVREDSRALSVMQRRFRTSWTVSKRSGTVTWRVGETIPAGLPRQEIEARVHAAINALEGPAT